MTSLSRLCYFVNTMLTGVDGIVMNKLLAFFNQIVALLGHRDIKGKMITGSFIQAQHLERSRRATTFEKTMDLQAFLIGVTSKNMLEGIGITVEIGDNWTVFRKECVKLGLL